MLVLNKKIPVAPFSVLLLLLIPLIAMQITDQVNWSPFDFLVMGVLLLGAAFTGNLVWRKVKNSEYRVLLYIALVLLFLLIWAELAVGILGTPFGGS